MNQHLKLNFLELLSSFGFKFKLRRYVKEVERARHRDKIDEHMARGQLMKEVKVGGGVRTITRPTLSLFYVSSSCSSYASACLHVPLKVSHFTVNHAQSVEWLFSMTLLTGGAGGGPAIAELQAKPSGRGAEAGTR